MATPEWAEEVIRLHQAFAEEGIEVECTYSEGRVVAVCPDVPSFIFPSRSWYVLKRHYKKGIVEENILAQVRHIKEYLNGN